MSNQLLGSVYSRIMDDVIENCQTTFEEDGVNQQTLEDLRSTWQKKLSALKVGSFPWDPPPAPQPMLNPTLPSNVPRPGQVPVSGAASSTSVPSNGPPRIKSEPSYEAPGIQSHGLSSNYGNNIARERAAQNLQQKFGPAALGQITQLQNPATKQQRGPMPANAQQPAQMTPEQQRAMQAEFQRRQTADYQKMQQNRRPVPTNAQTDGAGDWDDYVVQRRSEVLENPGAAHQLDISFREQVEQANRAMEGGGLMMPLVEQPKQPQTKRRRVQKTMNDLAAAQQSLSASGPKIPQLDGEDEEDDGDTKAGVKDELFDDDDDDDDAINSDLDDPDDNAIEEEQEEGRPSQIMLCTYDKVQRVKNKWKCTLRDGVLHSNGKEYVFTKANGEFEW